MDRYRYYVWARFENMKTAEMIAQLWNEGWQKPKES